MRLVRDGGKGVWRWGEKEIIYLSLHCHHQNDSWVKMGSNESSFNVSLTVRDKVTRQCPQTTTRGLRDWTATATLLFTRTSCNTIQYNLIPTLMMLGLMSLDVWLTSILGTTGFSHVVWG